MFGVYWVDGKRMTVYLMMFHGLVRVSKSDLKSLFRTSEWHLESAHLGAFFIGSSHYCRRKLAFKNTFIPLRRKLSLTTQ